jgi:HKD family nuclease
MPISARVMFERPQHEIASLLREKLRECRAAWIVTGFATEEGVEALSMALDEPAKLRTFVIGSGTYKGFEALDRLIAGGVSAQSLFVHLGFSRLTTSKAKHSFYRYHKMFHIKIYLFEMHDGSAVAFIGSHNVTGFALMGLNGEAAVQLEGDSQDVEILSIKRHIEAASSESVRYSSSMKDAYVW